MKKHVVLSVWQHGACEGQGMSQAGGLVASICDDWPMGDELCHTCSTMCRVCHFRPGALRTTHIVETGVL
jgi:hypothetical protein